LPLEAVDTDVKRLDVFDDGVGRGGSGSGGVAIDCGVGSGRMRRMGANKWGKKGVVNLKRPVEGAGTGAGFVLQTSEKKEKGDGRVKKEKGRKKRPPQQQPPPP